jgi:DNA-binding NtrC family response regulator
MPTDKDPKNSVPGGHPAFGDERTIPQQSTGTSQVPSFEVHVAEGAETGARHLVPRAAPHRFTVGKSAACDLVVTDPQVSRRHIAVEQRGSWLHVEDLGSTNGTFVNGVRIVEALLQGGETLRLGATVLRIDTREEKAAPRPSAAMGFGRMIGASPQMRLLYPFWERLAKSDIPVIIEGETGTGKELLAESLHEHSTRARGPFVVFDCTTVAPDLMEAVLFGHERGAFTGADAARPGVFERADGGTLFIDEIGDLQVGLQAKLLRAVERSEVRRVGGDAYQKFDVRVLCATRRDLEQAIQLGRFRDDLYHRLAVARIELPPLRNREGDVELLAQYFWGQMGGGVMPSQFLENIKLHRWPGNVRELYNLVARTIALGDLVSFDMTSKDAKEDEDPSALFARAMTGDLPFIRARDLVMNEFRRLFVERALARHGGSVPKAAAAAGVSRRYFDRIREQSRTDK